MAGYAYINPLAGLPSRTGMGMLTGMAHELNPAKGLM